MGNDHRLPRRSTRLLLATIGIGLVAVAVVCAGFLDFYYRDFAREVATGWVESQAVAIQQGNLLSAVTSQQRTMLSSRFVQGMAVRSLEEVRKGRPTLVEVGTVPADLRVPRPLAAGVVEVHRVGLFHYVAAYELPTSSPLLVIFDFLPAIALGLFAGNLLLFGGVFVALILYVQSFNAREGRRRQVALELAIGHLVADQAPGDSLKQAWPGVAGSWDSLTALINGLKRQIEEQTTAVAIARTTQMLAHDVRKPFAQMRAGLVLLNRSGSEDERRRALASVTGEVERSIIRVDAMIQDIMQIGAHERLNLEATCLAEVVAGTMHDLQTLRKTLVAVDVDVDAKHVAEIDRMKIERVLANILENAVQATGPTGRVWIRSEEAPEPLTGRRQVRLCIGNTGSWIAEGDIPRLFEPFFTKGKAGGTGLGLAIARQVVEAHGGRIWCVSSAAHGTEFWMTLPAGDLPIERRRVPRDRGTPAGLPQVILVEDDIYMAEAWVRALSEAQVTVFRSPSRMWEAFGADPTLFERQRCVITDYFFDQEEETGEHLLRAVRARQIDVPLLLCSNVDADLELAALADQIIPKQPMSWAALDERLNVIAARPLH